MRLLRGFLLLKKKLADDLTLTFVTSSQRKEGGFAARELTGGSR